MSRCFPYPPPGFEPPIDLLNKEKRKDKKHKKDKKEKEKREGKEKHRDRDRKDKKEKHKHKNRDKEREKIKEKEKIRSTDKTLEDSRFVDELAKRVGDGSQPASQFTDKRERKPVPVPVPNSVPSAQKRNDELAKSGPTSQKPSHHFTDSVERREKKSVPVPVPVPNSVAQRKNDELARPGSTNNNNNRATTSFNEKRVGQMSQEEGSNSKRTIQNSPNPNFRNPSFTNNANVPNSSSKNLNSTNHASSSNPNSKSPNLSLQRKSNGPATQINHSNNNHQHSTGFSERKVVPNEIKKPVPVPVPAPVPNSSQMRTNGTTASQKFATNHFAPQIDRKIDGPTRQIGLNNQLSGEKREREKVEREKEGKKEKKKETSEEREKRKEEKKRKKKEEKKQRKKEEKEREKAKQREKTINNKAGLLEGPQRNIEKIGGGFNEVSNKRKEMESNGFLHEDEMRAQKLLKTDQPQKRKDDLTNGFLHENDAGPTKLNKKLPLYPPLQNGKIHSSHTPSPIKPTISTTNYNNTPPDSKITKINNNTSKLDVNKTPQLSNGTVSDAKGDLVISKKGKEDSSKHSKRKEREESKESKPHRDLKYLSVVYSVPKLNEDELFPQDDQEWLIKRNPNSKNPNSERVVGETSEVWDRAVRIDSADLIALPYVIPF